MFRTFRRLFPARQWTFRDAESRDASFHLFAFPHAFVPIPSLLWEGSRLGFKYSDEVTVQHRAASVSRLLPSRHDARECWKRLRASELSADFRLGYGGNEEPSILMKRDERQKERKRKYTREERRRRGPLGWRKFLPGSLSEILSGANFRTALNIRPWNFARKYATTALGAPSARERTGIMRRATIESPLLIRPMRHDPIRLQKRLYTDEQYYVASRWYNNSGAGMIITPRAWIL